MQKPIDIMYYLMCIIAAFKTGEISLDTLVFNCLEKLMIIISFMATEFLMFFILQNLKLVFV
jgi:hypothetical protein